MEIRLSYLTKKPFKCWQNLFHIFMTEQTVQHAQNNEDGLSYFLMGLYHELGFMVPKDYDSALKYFRLGANKRDPLCLYKLYEIHATPNSFGIEHDRELALLYLVWAVLYMFPVYGSYMGLDFDLELQSYYKHTLKQDKDYVFQLIDDYDDDIFAHDKELVKTVFPFLIGFICAGTDFPVQQEYQKMIDQLIEITENSDPKFPALFLFKFVIWDFKGVTDRNSCKISNVIRKRKCVSFIFEQLKAVFDYIDIVKKRHTIFSRLIHFHSIEIFLQIKHNADPDESINKEEACNYLTTFLHDNLNLIDNNFTKFMAINFIAKRYMSRTSADKNLSQALNIIEKAKQLPGFVEEDFPFVLGGRICSELGDSVTSEKYFQKFWTTSENKSNLPSQLYEQGEYFLHCKRDNQKAIEAYLKGLELSSNKNTFLQECYANKCRDKIAKIVFSDQEMSNKYKVRLHNTRVLGEATLNNVAFA